MVHKSKTLMTEADQKEGVGLHRPRNPVEVIQAQTGMPFLKVNSIVKAMTADQKAEIVKGDPQKVQELVAEVNAKLLESNKATEDK